MNILLKAKQPFVDHVFGRGLVVFNEGTVDSLPEDKALERIEAGFAEEMEGEAAPEMASPSRPRGRPAKARPASTDAPVD